MDNLYTQKRNAQFRGPTTSDDYNNRIEEEYRDLALLRNKAALTVEQYELFYGRAIKEIDSLTRALSELETRISELEDGVSILSFYDSSQIDNDRFDSTDYVVSTADRCAYDTVHGLLTLPKVEDSSISKIKFTDNNGDEFIPSTFETLVVPNVDSADNTTATIDTSEVHHAVLSHVGSIWQRNVIADSADVDGAELTVYLRIPQEFASTQDSNLIVLHPYPSMSCDILSVEYSTAVDVLMNTNDSYTPLNSEAYHTGNDDAVGWVAPGAWDGDEILVSGPKAFYFDPTSVTGLKITLRQRNYYIENGKYIYTYGLSRVDLRYDKFLSTGRAIIKFDAPEGKTISKVEDVAPHAWNISEAELTDVFDYRVIWETSYNSGVYTTEPVAFSQRVWVEVTLNETVGKGTPALTDVQITYS